MSEQSELFSIEEHVVLAEYLGVDPVVTSPTPPDCEEALARMGFEVDTEYGRPSAAVAATLLNSIDGQLPNWCAGHEGPDGETEFQFAREHRPRRDSKLHLIPQFLAYINWADSGPGFSWPAAYHATWVPLYEVWVVTVSYDTPEVVGYASVAIGWFDGTGEMAQRALQVIRDDWTWQLNTVGVYRWAEVWDPGLFSIEQLESVADEVWADDHR
jgi:hypothetical protein